VLGKVWGLKTTSREEDDGIPKSKTYNDLDKGLVAATNNSSRKPPVSNNFTINSLLGGTPDQDSSMAS